MERIERSKEEGYEPCPPTFMCDRCDDCFYYRLNVPWESEKIKICKACWEELKDTGLITEPAGFQQFMLGIDRLADMHLDDD